MRQSDREAGLTLNGRAGQARIHHRAVSISNTLISEGCRKWHGCNIDCSRGSSWVTQPLILLSLWTEELCTLMAFIMVIIQIFRRSSAYRQKCHIELQVMWWDTGILEYYYFLNVTNVWERKILDLKKWIKTDHQQMFSYYVFYHVMFNIHFVPIHNFETHNNTHNNNSSSSSSSSSSSNNNNNTVAIVFCNLEFQDSAKMNFFSPFLSISLYRLYNFYYIYTTYFKNYASLSGAAPF